VVRDNEAKARLPKHGYAVQRRGQRRHSGLKHVDFTDDKRPWRFPNDNWRLAANRERVPPIHRTCRSRLRTWPRPISRPARTWFRSRLARASSTAPKAGTLSPAGIC